MQTFGIHEVARALVDPFRSGAAQHSGTPDRDERPTASTSRGRVFRRSTARHASSAEAASSRIEHDVETLAASVGDEAAPRVRDLLHTVRIESTRSAACRLALPHQAFFVLEGRVAVTIGNHPVVVLAPGGFFGGAEATGLSDRQLPQLHALGGVVLGLAGHLDLARIHEIMPVLHTIPATVGGEDEVVARNLAGPESDPAIEHVVPAIRTISVARPSRARNSSPTTRPTLVSSIAQAPACD